MMVISKTQYFKLRKYLEKHKNDYGIDFQKLEERIKTLEAQIEILFNNNGKSCPETLKEHHGIKIVDAKVVGFCSKHCSSDNPQPRYKDGSLVDDKDICCLEEDILVNKDGGEKE